MGRMSRSETPLSLHMALCHKKCVSKAYPYLDKRVIETTALDAFWYGHLKGKVRTMAHMRSPGKIEEASGFLTQYKGISPSGQRQVMKHVNCVRRGQRLRQDGRFSNQFIAVPNSRAVKANSSPLKTD